MKKIFTLLLTVMAMASAASAVEPQDIKIYIDPEDETSTVQYKNKNATITKYTDGTWTINKFIGSGQPLSFKFEQPAEGEYAAVTVTSPTEVTEGYEEYPYLMEADGKNYMECSVTEKTTNTVVKICWPYFYEDAKEKYPYVYRYAAGSEYNYMFSINLYGYTGYEEDDEDVSLEVYFWFNDMEAVEPTESGITEISASGNEAPVEYYNLNGIRVENPTNGLYIRKQGSEVKKVVL